MSAEPAVPRTSAAGGRASGPRLGRRALGRGAVLASASLVTAGCDNAGPLALPGRPDTEAETGPDHARVLAGLRDEQAVLERVQQVRRRHPELRGTLRPTAAVHQAHVELLLRGVEETGADVATGRGPGRVPADPANALADLVRLERRLAENHVGTAMRTRSGVLARAIASMSAAAAQQAVLLAPIAAREREQG